MMKFETDRLILRPFEEGDAQDLYAYASQKTSFEKTGKAACSTLDDAKHLLTSYLAENKRLAIVWKENNHVIGHITIKPDPKGKMLLLKSLVIY